MKVFTRTSVFKHSQHAVPDPRSLRHGLSRFYQVMCNTQTSVCTSKTPILNSTHTSACTTHSSILAFQAADCSSRPIWIRGTRYCGQISDVNFERCTIGASTLKISVNHKTFLVRPKCMCVGADWPCISQSPVACQLAAVAHAAWAHDCAQCM